MRSVRSTAPIDARVLLLTALLALGGLAASAVDAGPSDAPAQRDRPDDTAQLGGATHAVAAGEDGTLVIGVGPRLLTMGGCDPSRPTPLGQTPPLPGIVTDVALRGGHALVAVRAAGAPSDDIYSALVSVDVSSPATPRVVAIRPISGPTAEPAKITLDGPRAYVVIGFEGVATYDISDPSAPSELGRFGQFVQDIAVRGNTAFVVSRELMVFDVSTPAAAPQVGKLEDWADAVAVAGDVLYVAVSEAAGGATRIGALRSYDIRDPRSARPMHTLTTGDRARALALDGRRAYIRTESRVLVVDIGDPGALRELASHPAPAEGLWVAPAAGRWLLLAGGASGLHALDLSRAGAGARTAWTTVGRAGAVTLADGVAYVEDEGNGRLWVIDGMAAPAAPHPVARLPVEVESRALMAADGQLYVGTPQRELRIYDIARPTGPRLLGTLALPDAPLDLALSDGHVLVAADDFLRVIDARDPALLRERAALRTSGGATALAAADGVAYVTGPATGLEAGRPSLQVIDIENPAAPHELAAVSAAAWRDGVTVDGQHVYVGAVQVFDVSDPLSPREVGRLETPGRIGGLAHHEGRLYVAQYAREGGGSYREIDLTDPAAPSLRWQAGAAEAAQDVASDRGGRLVWTAGEAGLVRDEAVACCAPTPTALPRAARPHQILLPVAARGPIADRCRP